MAAADLDDTAPSAKGAVITLQIWEFFRTKRKIGGSDFQHFFHIYEKHAPQRCTTHVSLEKKILSDYSPAGTALNMATNSPFARSSIISPSIS